jgi:two-component system cell cycle response regulator
MNAPAIAEKENILVVDDTPDNLRVLLRALSHEGYHVRCARSGALAISGSLVVPPDLILLDVLMPQMDGYEVCQALRQNHQTRDVPVIFLSVLEDGADKARAFAAGGNDYIAKPYDLQEVMARVKHQLRLKQRQQEMLQSVSHFREAHRNLQSAHTFLQEVLNCLADGIGVFEAIRDDQGEISDFARKVSNPAFARLLGREDLSDSEVTLSQLTDPFSECELFDLCVQVLETDLSIRQEFHYLQEQRQHWVEVFATRLRDGVVTSLRDINTLKTQIAHLESMQHELFALATTDSLTQVANRYRFDAYLDAEWQRSLREQQPLSLIFGDIDRFKRFNDLCGHSMGDRCLQAVASALKRAVKRPADMVARYGGEEFAVLLPNTFLAGAVQVARMIQAQMRDLQLTESQVAECQQVQISLGIACTIPQEGGRVQRLLEAADRTLYQAKAKGGDTFCVENF